MDLLNVGALAGDARFWTVLLNAADEISKPGRFLCDETFQVLKAVTPERRSTLVTSQQLSGLHDVGDINVLPPVMRAVCFVHEQRLVFSYTGLLGLVLYKNNHYSLLLVDLVGQDVYHFDSFAGAGHGRIATQAARNLCLCGVLDPSHAENPLQHSIVFIQESTSCGIYVLAALRNVETALNSSDLSMGQSRQDIIMAALNDTRPERVVNEMRVELTNRIQAAACIMFNAMIPCDEDEEQARLLGSCCNRKALHAFMTSYRITVPLLTDTLADAIPPGMTINFHRVSDAAPSSMCSSNVIALMCKPGALTLIAITSGETDFVVSSLLSMNTGTNSCIFGPALSENSMAQGVVNTVCNAMSADQVRIRSNLVAPQNAGVLPLMLLSWWKRVGVWQQVADDPTKLLKLMSTEICLLSNNVRPAGFTPRMDWFLRRATGVAMCTAYDRLEQLRATGNCASLVHELDGHYARISAPRLRVRIRDQEERDMQVRLTCRVDAALAHARNAAPERWFSMGGYTELQAMYAACANNNNVAKMSEFITHIVRDARILSQYNSDPSLAHTIVTPLVNELFMHWPALLVGVSPYAEHKLVAVAPTSSRWKNILDIELMREPTASIGLRICPVLLYRPSASASEVECECIDMQRVVELESRDKLDNTVSLQLFTSDSLRLDLLGGSSKDCIGYASRGVVLSPARRMRPTFHAVFQTPGSTHIPAVNLR